MQYKKIELNDKEIEVAINNELNRQQTHIELIASENYVSSDVLKAAGSILTNKYGEGYVGKRYYGGCEFVDKVEQLAIDRLKKLFNVKFANVQAHSGSSANAAAIAAIINPGSKILGMGLDAGGHLTHGYKISFSGTFYQAYSYGVNQDGVLDYDDILKKAEEIKPDLIICGASAYSRLIDFKKFKEIADKVGAKLMADIAHIAGAIATGLHPSPVGYADIITSTTHKTLRGARGGIIMTDDEEIAKKVDRWIFPGYQGGPLFHIIAAKAVAFHEALQPEFKKYQEQIVKNAKAFCEKFKSLGAKIISNGTDNHLFIIDTKTSYNMTGKQATEILAKINITINKNAIPNDSEPPMVTSGIRLGVPAMTTRNLKENDFEHLAIIIDKALRKNDDDTLKELLIEVEKINKQFPINR